MPQLLEKLGVNGINSNLTLENLESAIHKEISAAESAWLDVYVPRERFLSFLTSRLLLDTPLEAGCRRLAVCDLYLACACISGDERAIHFFNSIVQEVARTAVTGIGVDDAVVDEVGQEFKVRALFGLPEKPPLLTQYKGLAPLRSWLRLMMVRHAIQLKNKQERERPFEDEVMDGLGLDSGDPELAYLKVHYLNVFRDAFKSALFELEVKERNLLRFLVAEDMTVQEISRFYNVNRRTIYKRLHKIRKRLLKRTRQQLASRLQLDPERLDSVIRLIRSRLDITVNCFADTADIV